MAEAPDFTMSEAIALHLFSRIDKNSKPDDKNDCIHFIGRHKKTGYGVIDVRFPNSARNTPMHVHRLVYMIHHRVLKLHPSDYHVSHLCHTRDCVNISHLVFEPQHINNARQHCYSEKICTKSHSPYPDCLL